MNLKNKINDSLFEAILNLETVDECYKFFIDLCTVKEIESMATRLEAAKLLKKGMTYDEILKKVDISTATLSRVSRALKYGEGGYDKIIEKTIANNK